MTSHFRLIQSGIDVAPLLADLDAHPEVWNQRPERRVAGSPHRETDDVWLRYATDDAMSDPDFAHKPHQSVWYPEFHALPGLWPIVSSFLAQFKPVRTGGALITRIPPGKQVYEHDDRGSWHAEFYTTKVWTVLRGNGECVNTVEDEAMVWKPGEAWTHSNLLRHSVTNGGDIERIVLITCFRRAS